MPGFLQSIFVADVLPPVYVSRTSENLWIEVSTNLGIGTAHFAIVLVLLLAFINKRRDIPFRPVFLIFGLFNTVRGVTQFLGVWTILHPEYQLEWEFRAITLLLAGATAVSLAAAMPAVLRLPTRGQWEREIFERLRAEEAARQAGERLDAVVDSVQDYAVYTIDTEGKVRTWDIGAERMKGYTAEEMIGQNFSRFYSPEDVAKRKPEEAMLIAREINRHEGEGWRYRKDGSRFWAHVILRPLRGAAGELVGYTKITRDLTESRETESKFQALLAAAPDAFLMINRQGRIVFANERMRSLFGYAPAEVIGRSVDTLVPPRFRGAHSGHRQTFFHSPATREMGAGRDLLALHRNGSEFAVEISLSPLETQDGTLAMAAVRDVTERKRLESRFRNLLESAPDAMVIVNPEGFIELTNLQTERLFGYTRMELIGQRVEILVSEGQRIAHEQHRLDFFTSPKQREMGAGLDLLAVRKDGSQFPVEISLSPLEGANGISVTAAIRDITGRRLADRRLAEKVEELGHSNEQLEQFAHIASHDLQEPLRMVASYTQLLAKRYKGRLDSDADEFIAYAVDGTQRMKRLIEDLLLYSRAGKGQPPKREFSSAKAVEAALRNLRAAIEESNAKITCGPLPDIVADESSLVQTFQNLIGNAIKYRGDREPSIHVSAIQGKGEWIFSVADNGIGIEAKYYDRIFQIFQRLHGREKYEGTGIGLAICQRVLQQQGGRIWVDSEPGQGSNFHFALPVS